MNHKTFPLNFATQNSDDEDSDEEINPRHLNKSRIAANMRRNNITNPHINTIPDDNDLVLNSISRNYFTNNPSNNDPSSSSSTSQSTSSSTSSSGWMSTRKIHSTADRVRFREEAKEIF